MDMGEKFLKPWINYKWPEGYKNFGEIQSVKQDYNERRDREVQCNHKKKIWVENEDNLLYWTMYENKKSLSFKVCKNKFVENIGWEWDTKIFK